MTKKSARKKPSPTPIAGAAGLDLQKAYAEMLLRADAYEQLGISPQLLYQYRTRLKAGLYPHPEKMREHLKTAGWEQVVTERWRMKK